MILHVGDKVFVRGSFGTEPEREVEIAGMQVTEHPREKYGEYVDSVDFALVDANRVVFDFTDGHWAYSEQVRIP